MILLVLAASFSFTAWVASCAVSPFDWALVGACVVSDVLLVAMLLRGRR